jgi:hypothetical protein
MERLVKSLGKILMGHMLGENINGTHAYFSVSGLCLGLQEFLDGISISGLSFCKRCLYINTISLIGKKLVLS